MGDARAEAGLDGGSSRRQGECLGDHQGRQWFASGGRPTGCGDAYRAGLIHGLLMRLL